MSESYKKLFQPIELESDSWITDEEKVPFAIADKQNRVFYA